MIKAQIFAYATTIASIVNALLRSLESATAQRVSRACFTKRSHLEDVLSLLAGQVPQSGYKAQNKRFRNKNSPKPDEGPVYGRHFAASFEDCIKLCTWTGGSCRSVNYGTLGGQKVCELLSNAVTKGSILETWLTDAQGWQFATVAP